ASIAVGGTLFKTLGRPSFQFARQIGADKATALKQAKLIRAKVTGVTSLGVFGAVAGESTEKEKNFVMFALAAIPLGLTFHAFKSIGARTPKITDGPGRAEAYQGQRAARPFNQETTPVPEVRIELKPVSRSELEAIERGAVEPTAEARLTEALQRDVDAAKERLGQRDVVSRPIEEIVPETREVVGEIVPRADPSIVSIKEIKPQTVLEEINQIRAEGRDSFEIASNALRGRTKEEALRKISSLEEEARRLGLDNEAEILAEAFERVTDAAETVKKPIEVGPKRGVPFRAGEVRRVEPPKAEPVPEAPTEVLEAPTGTTKLYRVESPEVLFEDVAGEGVLGGKFFTSDLKVAEALRENLGPEARIESIDFSTERLSKFEVRPGEFVIETAELAKKPAEVNVTRRAALQGAGDGQAGKASENPYIEGTDAFKAYDEAYNRAFDVEVAAEPDLVRLELPVEIEAEVNQRRLLRELDQRQTIANEVVAELGPIEPKEPKTEPLVPDVLAERLDNYVKSEGD
ncbi:hypothetical protein LCGC14_2442460, partial [marine sediment metagenome]